jgi:hypothetical protein
MSKVSAAVAKTLAENLWIRHTFFGVWSLCLLAAMYVVAGDAARAFAAAGLIMVARGFEQIGDVMAEVAHDD